MVQPYADKRIPEGAGMNTASASYYPSAVIALLPDREIKHSISRHAADLYPKKIRDDFGEKALRFCAAESYMGNLLHAVRFIR